MIINSANIKMWSKIGPRGMFGLTLHSLAETNKDILVLTADLGQTSGLERFKTTYPERFINTGIAEQNMMGMAAGLTKEGYNVFCSTFATFASMRSFEMAKLNMGYMNFNIKLVGLASGFAMGFFGNTHYSTEDIALMRTIPNLCILSPADCTEVVKVVSQAATHNGPIYIRLTGTANCPIVYPDDYNFEIGKAITLKEGSDIAIFATGSMVYQSLEAAKILNANNISAAVINMHTLKPLDTKIITQHKNKKLIVTVEEHSIIGGLGCAISEFISKDSYPKHLTIGSDDSFKKAGSYKYMLEQNGLTAQQIANKIINAS
jgi:transketolase